MSTAVGKTLSIAIDPSSNIYGDRRLAAVVTARDVVNDPDTGEDREFLTLRTFGRDAQGDRTLTRYERAEGDDPDDDGSTAGGTSSSSVSEGRVSDLENTVRELQATVDRLTRPADGVRTAAADDQGDGSGTGAGDVDSTPAGADPTPDTDANTGVPTTPGEQSVDDGSRPTPGPGAAGTGPGFSGL